MAEAKSTNVGSASHLGENQTARDSHFIFDYTFRRVPMPIISYMAVADSRAEQPSGESAAKMSLNMLRDLVEPAVIAEEEITSPNMEKLIKESFARLNTEMKAKAITEKNPETRQASLTMVIADRKRAYIGHLGSNRIYLLHDERLYDLTPTGELSAPEPIEDTLTLFSVPAGGEGQPEPSIAVKPSPGGLLGEADEVKVGYNEVEIAPGDMIVLVSDGLWSTISEEEIVENLLSAMNVQRSTSQLTRLAFTRDPSDNATMAAWQYVIPGETVGLGDREIRSRERKERAVEVLIVMLLAVILAAIFAVGVAFGWRITDAFRKPVKEASKQTGTTSTKTEPPVESSATQPGPTGTESTAPAPVELTATVKGQGVRMRTTPDTQGDLVGILTDGETVTIIGQVVGSDSKTWTKARGKVKSGGKDIDGEGFIRNDFLVFPPGQTVPTITSSAPASSSP